MTLRDRIYIGSLAILAVVVAIVIRFPALSPGDKLASLLVLGAMATVSQFFEVRLSDGRSYYPHSVFFFAGVLLLEPILLLPLFAIPLILAAIRTRKAEGTYVGWWCDLTINVAVQALVGTCAHWLYITLNSHLNEIVVVGQVFAVFVAATVYVMGNHVILRVADVLINKSTWREAGLWIADNLWAEFVMAYLGYIVALLWFINPAMIVPMLGVLVLIQKALMLPKLRHEAQTDSKTGLLNIRYFNQLMSEAMVRAKQTGRPFSVIMADLDFLRRINNTYGHLAGDMVLIGVSKIIQYTVRHEDAVGRFGGEEFAVLLPGVEQEEAYIIAERIRVAIEAGCFEVPTSQTPLKTTMSLGIASYPQDGETITELVHQADVAVYQAKMDGRNRIVSANDLYYRIKDEALQLAAEPEDGSAVASAELLQKHARPLPPRARELTMQFPVQSLPVSPLAQWLSPFIVKTGAVLLAALLVVFGAVWQQPVDWTAVICLMTLAGITQYLCVHFFAVVHIPVVAAFLFTASLLTGLPGVALVSATSVLAGVFAQTELALPKRFNGAVLYQWATDVIACCAPALLTTILTFSLHINHVLLFVIPFLIVALAYSYTTIGLTAFAHTIVTGKGLTEVWQEEYQQLPLYYLLLSLIGLCFAIVYTMFGWKGMLLSAFPIYVMYFSQEQLAGQTRQWWGNFALTKKQWS